MKKIILFFLVVWFLFSFSPVFADILPPFEDRCAKTIVTKESKEEAETCMKDCLAKMPDGHFFCEKYSCWNGDICLYTNKDKKTLSLRYLEAEKEAMIIKSTIILLVCAGIFVWTFIYRKRKKNHV